jgi:hypothetical protein
MGAPCVLLSFAGSYEVAGTGDAAETLTFSA